MIEQLGLQAEDYLLVLWIGLIDFLRIIRIWDRVAWICIVVHSATRVKNTQIPTTSQAFILSWGPSINQPHDRGVVIGLISSYRRLQRGLAWLRSQLIP